MTPRMLTILAGVTLVALVAAIWMVVQQDRSVQPRAQEPLFPDIEERLAAVRAIRITTGEHEFTIRQGEDGTWVVPEQHGYPANLERARQLAQGFAEAERVEPKTANPDLYSEIGVGAPQEDPNAKHVALLDNDGETVAELIVGERQLLQGSSEVSRTYVRQPAQQRAWLITGLPQVPATPMEWLQRDFLELARNRVQSVTIRHPDGEDLTVTKDSPDAEHFALEDMPETHKLRYEGAADVLAGALTAARFEDVMPAEEVDMAEATEITFRTFDGLVLDLRLLQEEETYRLTAEASVDEDTIEAFETGEGAAQIPASGDVRGEAETLNNRLQDWVYRIPRFLGMDLAKNRDDFIEPKSESEKADAS